MFKIKLLLVFFISLSFGGSKRPCGDSLPIIYSNNYNISILGIENFHPFDSKKYEKVYHGLISEGHLCPRQFYKPSRPSDEILLLVHTPEYLRSLKKSSVVASIAEIPPLEYLPNFILQNSLLEPMRLATGGTILGVHLALRYGWAINLSGGYHHAKADKGGGFCIFADVPIALRMIWKEKPDLKVLIVDLDAHQGNGNSSILGDDSRVSILDMFNASIYPQDQEAAQKVKYRIELRSRLNTSSYLDSLKKWLPIVIETEKPGLIVYNAGTDVYLADHLGRLSISEQGIIDRDEYVFLKAFENNIPILMVLSGGYTKKSGLIITNSIENILNTIKEKDRRREEK